MIELGLGIALFAHFLNRASILRGIGFQPSLR